MWINDARAYQSMKYEIEFDPPPPYGTSFLFWESLNFLNGPLGIGGVHYTGMGRNFCLAGLVLLYMYFKIRDGTIQIPESELELESTPFQAWWNRNWIDY